MFSILERDDSYHDGSRRCVPRSSILLRAPRFAGFGCFIARSRMPSEASAKEGHPCIMSILSRLFLGKATAICV